jgi:hypothetical protein
MTNTAGSSRSVDADVSCYYAGDPTRPECQVHAVVAYGPVALCSSCDQRRSTVGKGMAPRRLGPNSARRQALQAIEAARHRLTEAEVELARAVALARSSGCSWSQLGQALGVSRQGAQQRYGLGSEGGGR